MIGVGLILVSLLVLTAALGRPVTTADTGGAGWLPADGHRQRFAGPDGVEASEWAIGQAATLIGSGPGQFFTWLSLTKLDWATAGLARLSTVRLTGAGQVSGRSDDLFSIGSDGVRAEVVSGFDDTSLVYAPGRLDLPDNLAAGRSWTSEGAVLVTDAGGATDTAGYRAEFSATAAGDRALTVRGCLVVTMREQIGDNQPASSERTWCRHAGITGFATDAGRWQPTDPLAARVTPEAPFDWSGADRLSFTARKVNQLGVGTTLVSPVSAPGILADGTVVYANQVVPDVIALATAVDPPPAVWRARPGVRNTAAATFGTTTVVANVNRQLVAYGPAGEWLWEVRLPDLAVVRPARLGDLVVVATLDGSVTGYDLATGDRRWQQQLGIEVRVPPLVAGERVLVVDQGGQLTCFDAPGNQLWSTRVGRVEDLAVSAGPDPVVVIPNSDGPRVSGLSLADGSQRWTLRHRLTTQDVIALDRVVVLRDEDETVGLDPGTGQRIWSWRGPRTFAGIGGGGRLLLLGADRLVLLDGDGNQVTEWPVAIGDPSSGSAYLVAAHGRVLVHGPNGVMLGVVAR